jgi:hypothetical protein
MFPKLQTLVLYNVSEPCINDLEPYLTLLPFIQHVTLTKCSLNKASTLICLNLLGHGATSQLQSCVLHNNHRKNGIGFHEPIPSFCQVQQSPLHLQIHITDFISLKNLLQFLPKLLTIGKLLRKPCSGEMLFCRNLFHAMRSTALMKSDGSFIYLFFFYQILLDSCL